MSRPAPQRGYPQDYIVRIRYQNNLPPPSCPPKLLDIPNNAASEYTDPSFASQLARLEPLSIEVDPELGMPLNMVGVPRVFEGDDSAIEPIKPIPPVHPRDRALLRPATSLGKVTTRTTGAGSAVSFLRRTEYISSEQSRSTFKSQTSDRIITTNRIKRTVRPEDHDPIRILQAVLKGFDVANPDTAGKESGLGELAKGDKTAATAERNWKEPVHPYKPHLKVVETFPLLPDFNAVSDAGGYMIFKFAAAPVSASAKRDTRLDVALLKPHDKPTEEDGNVDPSAAGQASFDYYVPSTEAGASRIKRKFADYADDPASLSDDDEPPEDPEECRYDFIRSYETKKQKQEVSEEVALVLNKGTDGRPRGAYFYPIMTRYTLQPKRKRRFLPGILARDQEENDEDETTPEIMNVRVRGLNAEEIKRRGEMKSEWDGKAQE